MRYIIYIIIFFLLPIVPYFYLILLLLKTRLTFIFQKIQANRFSSSFLELNRETLYYVVCQLNFERDYFIGTHDTVYIFVISYILRYCRITIYCTVCCLRYFHAYLIQPSSKEYLYCCAKKIC